jgi:hypothetical protein
MDRVVLQNGDGCKSQVDRERIYIDCTGASELTDKVVADLEMVPK